MDEHFELTFDLAGKLSALLAEVDANLSVTLHALALTSAAVIVGGSASDVVDETTLAADHSMFIEQLNSLVAFTTQQMKLKING